MVLQASGIKIRIRRHFNQLHGYCAKRDAGERKRGSPHLFLFLFLLLAPWRYIDPRKCGHTCENTWSIDENEYVRGLKARERERARGGMQVVQEWLAAAAFIDRLEQPCQQNPPLTPAVFVSPHQTRPSTPPRQSPKAPTSPFTPFTPFTSLTLR